MIDSLKMDRQGNLLRNNKLKGSKFRGPQKNVNKIIRFIRGNHNGKCNRIILMCISSIPARRDLFRYLLYVRLALLRSINKSDV